MEPLSDELISGDVEELTEVVVLLPGISPDEVVMLESLACAVVDCTVEIVLGIVVLSEAEEIAEVLSLPLVLGTLELLPVALELVSAPDVVGVVSRIVDGTVIGTVVEASVVELVAPVELSVLSVLAAVEAADVGGREDMVVE